MTLFRTVLVYFTIGAVLSSTLMVPLAYMDFQMRKEYISEVLCINKTKPQLDCGGKCFLTKQLKQAEQSKKTEGPVTERFQISFFNHLIPDIEQQIFGITIELNTFLFSRVPISFIHQVFHPPEVDAAY